MSDERTLLVDASVFITLAAIDRHDLLAELDGRVVVPEAVAGEIADDPAASHLEDGVESGWLTVSRVNDDERLGHAASHLDAADGQSGDVALLASAMARDAVVVTDDKPLRKACKALSVPVSGSIGALVRAVERGDLAPDEAKEDLEAMDEVGARLSARLFRRAESLIDDAA